MAILCLVRRAEEAPLHGVEPASQLERRESVPEGRGALRTSFSLAPLKIDGASHLTLDKPSSDPKAETSSGDMCASLKPPIRAICLCAPVQGGGAQLCARTV